MHNQNNQGGDMWSMDASYQPKTTEAVTDRIKCWFCEELVQIKKECRKLITEYWAHKGKEAYLRDKNKSFTEQHEQAQRSMQYRNMPRYSNESWK